jgi:hypothetical protein
MVLYEKVGDTAWSIRVASRVPMLWKIFVLLAMFTTIWYVACRIDRRGFDPLLPALDKRWLIWLAIVALTFAVITADKRVLFHIGTCSCMAFMWIEYRYYRWKGEKLGEGKVY